MSILPLHAFCKLIQFDIFLMRNNFSRLHEKVRLYPLARNHSHAHDLETICTAVDAACIWYWKQALCLQRSAATVCLLKHYGIPAQMVIGAQPVPFRMHAWVEVDGRVVNDKSYLREHYAVLDLCG